MPSLTRAELRDLPHEDLLERLELIVGVYDKPQVETQGEKMLRISRTLDEAPEIHRYLLGLWSWLDHWTDAMAEMFGQKDKRYKALRERRDLLDKMASNMKMRYEAASRLITLMESFDPTGMPRQRRSNA